jgi:hypothetical protein
MQFWDEKWIPLTVEVAMHACPCLPVPVTPGQWVTKRGVRLK